jgi:hypothetical protein
MAGHGEKLTRGQERYIALLLTEPTRAAAARAAGISARTADRWARDPGFAAAYRKARHRVLDDVVTTLHRLCTDAAAALGRNLNCGRPAAEIRAACAILQNALAGAELMDLEGRLAEVEEYIRGARDESGKAPRAGPAIAWPATNGRQG